MADALTTAFQTLATEDYHAADKNILFFTDGMPTCSPQKTIEISKNLRKASVNIVAVATRDADFAFLSELTGDKKSVIEVENADFANAFKRAGEMIFNRQAFDVSDGDYSHTEALMRAGGWATLLSVVILSALAIAENFLMGNSWPTLKQTVVVLGCGCLSGFVAGAVSQGVYDIIVTYMIRALKIAHLVAYGLAFAALIAFLCLLKQCVSVWIKFGVFLLFISSLAAAGNIGSLGPLSYLPASSRFLGWGIWGAILIASCGLIVPNYNKRLASMLGAIGGLFCCAIFTIAVSSKQHIEIARVVASIIIGGLVAYLICLVKKVGREMYMEIVDRTTGQIQTVNLGAQNVLVGQRSASDAAEISLKNGSAIVANEKQSSCLSVGETVVINNKEYRMASAKNLKTAVGMKVAPSPSVGKGVARPVFKKDADFEPKKSATPGRPTDAEIAKQKKMMSFIPDADRFAAPPSRKRR